MNPKKILVLLTMFGAATEWPSSYGSGLHLWWARRILQVRILTFLRYRRQMPVGVLPLPFQLLQKEIRYLAKPVLRIRDVLVLIRIRIRWSLPLLINFFRYAYIIFQRAKVIKMSQNSRYQCFSSYFYLVMVGSGSVPLTNGSGSVPLTKGSGSVLLRIRIQEAQKYTDPHHCSKL
jgi:hypothetical protein